MSPHANDGSIHVCSVQLGGSIERVKKVGLDTQWSQPLPHILMHLQLFNNTEINDSNHDDKYDSVNRKW